MSQNLGGYLEASHTRSISFHRLYFSLIWLLCPAKPAMTDERNLIFDPTCHVISGVLIKFCNIFGKFKPGAFKYRFRIENRSSRWSDSRGPKCPPPPPPSVGRIGKYPIGVRVKWISRKNWCLIATKMAQLRISF